MLSPVHRVSSKALLLDLGKRKMRDDLEILKQGVSAWNDWRDSNPSIVPDLRARVIGTPIFGADLAEYADRIRAHRKWHLEGTKLFEEISTRAGWRAGLEPITAVRSVLSNAKLSGINFRWTRFRWARIVAADLSGADLTQVDLSFALLQEVSLRGADLTGARLWRTSFVNVDLADAKGLDGCEHDGPSFLCVTTLLRNDHLPAKFLRSCGVPIALVNSLERVRTSVAQFRSSFICYSSKDEAFANRLRADLNAAGVSSWFAPLDQKPGDAIRESLVHQVGLQDRLLVVLSKDSIESPWVAMEVEEALKVMFDRADTVLIPLMLDNTPLSADHEWLKKLRAYQAIADFKNWVSPESYAEAFQNLLGALRRPGSLSKEI